MLIELLYRYDAIPGDTNPHKVGQLHNHLVRKLVEDINKPYIWLASATRAVHAGMYKGRKRIRRRRKLLHMINTCRSFLGRDRIALPDRWENTNLFFGYDACRQWSEATGASIETAVMLGFIQSGLLKIKED